MTSTKTRLASSKPGTPSRIARAPTSKAELVKRLLARRDQRRRQHSEDKAKAPAEVDRPAALQGLGGNRVDMDSERLAITGDEIGISDDVGSDADQHVLSRELFRAERAG